MFGPNPDVIHLNENIPSVCYIKNVITRPNIEVGEYTYYDDAATGGEDFEAHVTHHYEFNGANHRMASVTTHPFNIFAHGWEKCTPTLEEPPLKGDTVVGNDVWMGQNVTVLSGVHIGDGTIIGANSVVAGDIPPYTVAAGNLCRGIRPRFDQELTDYLLELRWWDWNPEKIFRNLEALCSGNLEQIRCIEP